MYKKRLVCKKLIIVFVMLITTLTSHACKMENRNKNQIVYSSVDLLETKLISDDAGLVYSDYYINSEHTELGSLCAIFSQQDLPLYDVSNRMISLLSKENEYVLFLEDNLKKQELKLLNVDTGKEDKLFSVNNVVNYDFLIYKSSIYYLKREKNGCKVFQLSLSGEKLSEILIEHNKCKMLGIVDDRIYYAFSDKKNRFFINQNYTVESCDLNGKNEKIILTSDQAGVKKILSVIKMKVNKDDLFFLVQGGDGERIVRINMDTNICNDIARGFINDFDLGNNTIFYTKLPRNGKRFKIYRLELTTLKEESFLEDESMRLWCNDEWLYYEKIVGRENYELCRVKHSGKCFENLTEKNNKL